MECLYAQYLGKMQAAQDYNKIFELLTPMLSTIIGGLITLITTLLVLKRDNKNVLKRMILEKKISEKEEEIKILKDYYVQFCNYSMAIYSHFDSFGLVVNSEMTYVDWFTMENEDKPYNHAEIELATFLFDDMKKIDEFYSIRDKLNELYMITECRKYKTGMNIEIKPEEYIGLIEALSLSIKDYKKFICNEIKLKISELSLIKEKES